MYYLVATFGEPMPDLNPDRRDMEELLDALKGLKKDYDKNASSLSISSFHLHELFLLYGEPAHLVTEEETEKLVNKLDDDARLAMKRAKTLQLLIDKLSAMMQQFKPSNGERSTRHLRRVK